MRQGTRRVTSFRLLIAGLAVAAAGPAIAQSCVQPAERAGFEVRALQSQLMVAALQCQRDTDYNAFVRKFQPDLAASYRSMEGHFRRTVRGSHQRELDGFITQLANAQSQDGIRAGSHFCPLVTPLFGAAMAQSNASGLAELAVDRNILNPLTTPTCAASAPAAAPSRSPSRPAASNRSAAVSR